MDIRRKAKLALYVMWLVALIAVIAIWAISGQAADILFALVLLAVITACCAIIPSLESRRKG